MTRIITALVLVIVTGTVLYLSQFNNLILPAYGLIALCACCFEYIQVVEKKTFITNSLKQALFIGLITGPFLVFGGFCLSLSYLISLTILLLILFCSARFDLALFNHWLTRMLPAFVLIAVGGASLLNLSKDLNLLFLVILIATVNDVTAYELGSVFQGPKLAPAISPKKTIVGSVSGLIAGVLSGVIFLTATLEQINVKAIVILIIAVLLAQFGDLLKSVVKREHDVKDFSNLLPGHGGVLDRLDAMLLASIAINYL